MTTIISTIAKLLRTDESFVRRAWSTAQSADSAEMQPPKEFASGKGALAFSLSYFVINKPVTCVLGSLGLVAFAVYEAIRNPLLVSTTILAVAFVSGIYRIVRGHG